MTESITLKLSDIKGATGNIKVENNNINIIKNIFPDFKSENGVTSTQFKQLLEIAKIAGDKTVLEAKDIANGINRLKSDITKGNAYITTGFLNLIQGGNWTGDIYLNIPKGTRMDEIKVRYKLADGALRDYCDVAGAPGGDFDRFETIANQVWFSIEGFAKGNNLTIEQVKELFNNKK